jgi:precorrin-2 dehydrogenase/sirohydrochlorin ferrochelatase
MIPIHLDADALRIGLVGRGDLAVRRLAWLRAGGGEPCVFSDAPEEALAAAAGEALRPYLPGTEELLELDLVWIADLPAALAKPIYAAARGVKTLVNVEDVMPLCDFHTPALVRRGRLLVSVGTGGASPAVAAAARARAEAAFPDGWAALLDEIAAARNRMRADGAAPAALKADAEARIAAAGL